MPAPPSRGFPLGTDQLGRDILARVIYGARVSLTIGIAAMLTATLIGVTIGLLAGFHGGLLDMALLRFTDMNLALRPFCWRSRSPRSWTAGSFIFIPPRCHGISWTFAWSAAWSACF